MSDQKRDALLAVVRAVLTDAVLAFNPEMDDLDAAIVDLAADAATTILILDARLKFGPLNAEQADAYTEATRTQLGALRALRIENPYQPQAN